MSAAGPIVATVEIARTPAEVFAFAATPWSWPQWHPTATSVSGVTDRPVTAGDHVTEQDRFAVLCGTIVWQVLRADPGRGWSIHGAVHGLPFADGTTTAITYTLTPVAGGTRLGRTMTYTVPGRAARALDRLYFRRHNRQQSERAVRGLKALLEARQDEEPS